MSCLINSGYNLDCNESLGGVKKVYIATFDGNVAGSADYTYDANRAITAVTNSPTYYLYEQTLESASFTQAGVFSIENGSAYCVQQVSMVFPRNTDESRNLLIQLAHTRISVIVEDQRGELWLVGRVNGLRATAGSQNTGKSLGDLNGVTITLQGKESTPAHRIHADAAFDGID